MTEDTQLNVHPYLAANYYQVADYSFRLKITFDGDQSEYAMSGQVFTLSVKCGSSSTSISLDTYPTSKGPTQYIGLASADVFELPYIVSSLHTTYSSAGCAVNSV